MSVGITELMVRRLILLSEDDGRERLMTSGAVLISNLCIQSTFGVGRTPSQEKSRRLH